VMGFGGVQSSSPSLSKQTKVPTQLPFPPVLMATFEMLPWDEGETKLAMKHHENGSRRRSQKMQREIITRT
jgi:hypothetical protein